MKIKKNIIFSVLFLVTLFSCSYKSEDAIRSISYDIENGGKGTASSSLFISKDSTKYIWANYKETKTRSEATVPETWIMLLKIINLEDFDKVSSSERRIQYDGSDVVITINSDKEHKLINGEQDSTNYNKIKPLKLLLNKEYKRLDSIALNFY